MGLNHAVISQYLLNIAKKASIYTSAPAVYRILFQIHGSKFKPDPFAYLGKTFEICESHRVLFFCVCKHSFYRFFSLIIQLFHTCGVPYVFDLFKIIEPDVFGDSLFAFSILSTLAFVRTAFAYTIIKLKQFFSNER